jgi:hypothetical protein
MDLPFQDTEETSHTRRIVLGEIERVQASFSASLQPGAANTFAWQGATYWVDRQRWLVLNANEARAFSDATTVPDAEEDLLSYYGGDGRTLHVDDAVDVLAWLVSGTLDKHSWQLTVTHVMNLVMIQPLVNPACAPLFWVAMNTALAGDDSPADLMAIMRPMTFDMARYPGSRSEAPAVRQAQADYVRRRHRDGLPQDWARLDDRAWADACKQVFAAARYGIESHVLEPITRRAELIRAGRWPG